MVKKPSDPLFTIHHWMDCEQPALPALQTGITIDESVRGRSFYAPAE